MSAYSQKIRTDMTTVENEVDDQMNSLSKSYNDLIFLQNYSSMLSIQKDTCETEVSSKIYTLSREMISKAAKKSNFNEITELDLTDKKITNFTNDRTFEPYELSSLEALNLSANHLTSLSGVIFLFGLKSLDISNNKITTLLGIDALLSLKTLNANNNKLSSLYQLRGLPKLKILDISRNKIENLDELIIDLKSLPKLNNLSCQKNPISFDYFYKNDILVQLSKLKYLNESKLSETDFEIARTFFRHFQTSKNLPGENSSGEENESEGNFMAKSDFFGKKGFALKLRNLAKQGKKNQKLESMSELKLMACSSINFKKNKDIDVKTACTKNIKTRVLQNESCDQLLNFDGLQNRIKNLEKELFSKDREIEELKSKNSVLELELEDNKIIIEQNEHLNSRIKKFEEVLDFDCNSLKCKEMNMALSKKLQESMSELMEIRRVKSKTSEVEQGCLSNVISISSFGGISLQEQTLKREEINVNDENNKEEDDDLEKALQESLSKISEAKGLLRDFYRESEKPNLVSCQTQGSRIELKPVKRTSGLLKNKMIQSKLKESFAKKV